MMERLREHARRLKQEIRALIWAMHDPRVPWYAKLLAGAIVAYAISPIDLVPDAIPVLGLLDDLMLLPAAIFLVVKLIPADVMVESRAHVEATPSRRLGLAGAALILVVWALAAGVSLVILRRLANWP